MICLLINKDTQFRCGDEVYARGLCNKHYVAALRLIKKYNLSWDKLVSKGLAIKNQRIAKIRLIDEYSR